MSPAADARGEHPPEHCRAHASRHQRQSRREAAEGEQRRPGTEFAEG
jgi:hypothetical protein